MDVVILGRIGYDLYAEDHNAPLKEVRRFSRYVGGSSANMAVGLSRLGLRVGMISCVGTDPLSDYVVEYLEHEGVATRFVQRKAGYVCSLSLTEVSPPNHFPQVFYRDRPADTQVEVGGPEQEFIESARMFVTNGTSLCASPSRESTYRALESAHQSRRAGGFRCRLSRQLVEWAERGRVVCEAGAPFHPHPDCKSGRDLHGCGRNRCRPGRHEAAQPGGSTGRGQDGIRRDACHESGGIGLSSFLSGPGGLDYRCGRWVRIRFSLRYFSRVPAERSAAVWKRRRRYRGEQADVFGSHADPGGGRGADRPTAEQDQDVTIRRNARMLTAKPP